MILVRKAAESCYHTTESERKKTALQNEKKEVLGEKSFVFFSEKKVFFGEKKKIGEIRVLLGEICFFLGEKSRFLRVWNKHTGALPQKTSLDRSFWRRFLIKKGAPSPWKDLL